MMNAPVLEFNCKILTPMPQYISNENYNIITEKIQNIKTITVEKINVIAVYKDLSGILDHDQ